ncbi:hypothetical protein 9F7_35 [uncultured Caudovirales phage]|uniref:Uncharacterized protein n=1 Tax=uncultured Caudovirales phage TaxID=2100421 RepID=A0A2H4J0J5_9CAUD|nr:hypothetical protein 10F2_9 [uncultured Caudovirales phage]ASN68027.1 hypothetical protein 3S4_98 [uncultured Caudovirales phage]ASN68419.1 hypothetical protein 3F6_78 [uncultured Caudovirales phage]ASN68472.1 hypothetical protein 9F7_35 [uncultured Caudovirales phage]ASN68623.1 hypothetical protein 8S7_90 [uncultured Caudovirales phage]
MGHFVITFRFEYDGSYQERYDSFTKKVREIASAQWEETSSFYAIEASGTAESIRDTLYFQTGFMESKDQMVVIDLDNRVKAIKGNVKYTSTLARCLGF